MESSTVILLAVVSAAVILAAVTIIRIWSGMIGGRTRPTEFLDASRETCGICFGDLGRNVKICGCGKRFHNSCAEPTGTCPYCSTPYTEFHDVKEDRTRCPNCGRYISGGVCRCGAVLSKDGVFVCACGSVIDEELRCTGCGKRYERK